VEGGGRGVEGGGWRAWGIRCGEGVWCRYIQIPNSLSYFCMRKWKSQLSNSEEWWIFICLPCLG